MREPATSVTRLRSDTARTRDRLLDAAGELLAERWLAFSLPDLARVVESLIASGVIPEQDTDYAVLVWITVFDERVVIDLRTSLGWSPAKTARTLSASVLGAWRAVLA